MDLCSLLLFQNLTSPVFFSLIALEISLSDLQPNRKRFTISGCREELAPSSLIKINSIDDDNDFFNIIKKREEERNDQKRTYQSFKEPRDKTHKLTHFAKQDTQDELRLESILHASSRQKGIRRQKSQNQSLNMLGSGIPLIDIDEDRDEDMMSSCEESEEDQEQFIYIDTNQFSQQVNLIIDEQDQSIEKQQRQKIRKPSVSDSYVVRSINAEDLMQHKDEYGELEAQDSYYFLQNDFQIENPDIFLLEKDVKEEEKQIKEGTPRFGDVDKYKLYKFVFRNEQQRTKFLKELDLVITVWLQIQKNSQQSSFIEKKRRKSIRNQLNSQNQLLRDASSLLADFSTMAESEQLQSVKISRKTIVFCDLHRLLIYIRKSQASSHDLMIRTKSNGIQVRFYVTVRRGIVQALLKLRQKFDLVLYTSLDKDMGDAILDHIEKNLANGQKLFDQRFHATDCDSLTFEDLGLIEVRQRSLDLVIQSHNKFVHSFLTQNPQNALKPDAQLTQRSEKTVVMVTHNMKEVAYHVQNIVPIKGFDGKRSKNSTIMNLAIYLYQRILNAQDVREVIIQDFLQLSSRQYEIEQILLDTAILNPQQTSSLSSKMIGFIYYLD